MTPITYVLLSLGDEMSYHAQAHLCFISLKKNVSPNTKFVLYTDRPEYFTWLSSFVDVRVIQEEERKEWVGPHNYFYRIKIMSLLDSCKKDEGHLVFLDSDVYIARNLKELTEGLDQGNNFMHLKEHKMSDTNVDREKVKMWTEIKDKTLAGIEMSDELSMWNSGVIALNKEMKKTYLEKALALNDELCCLKNRCRVKEQFAIGAVLEKDGKLQESDQWIIHYWGNKEEWNASIKNWLMELLMQKKTPLEAVQELDEDFWEALPNIRKVKSLKKRIMKLINNNTDKVKYAKLTLSA